LIDVMISLNKFSLAFSIILQLMQVFILVESIYIDD